MGIRRKAVIFLATGGYAGYMPFAPGTFGTLVGMPLCYLLSRAGFPMALAFTAGLVLLAAAVSGEAERIFQSRDPGSIVIDEIAGIAVTLLGFPFNGVSAVSGFLVFRMLDIIKPFPIGYLEKRLRGGTGVVMDDVLAGIFGNLLLRLFF
jgi:phosphatidylglycerophosphatase A